MVVDETKYNQAMVLRKNGESYDLISKKLSIPKSTLSSWFSHQLWSDEIKNNLNLLRLRKSSENLIKANLIRTKNQKEKRVNYIREAQIDFNKLINNPLFLVGLSIYWGEGDKTDNGRVSVINTDPELLNTVVKFYRECLGISDDKLRIGLFIYKDINQDIAIKFWSDKLKIPKQQFIKIQKLKSRSRLAKNKIKFGICSLYFSSTMFSIKIHEWIRLLSIHELKN